MAPKLDIKTFLILGGIIICVLLAVIFGFHILWPALDPVATDMIKIFFAGAGCGLLIGIWIGRKLEKRFEKKGENHT